jgi:hypothetical protein
MASIINATTTTGLVSSADTSGVLQLATNNGVTALTINASQNVGIGDTTPDYKLTVIDTGNDIQLAAINSGTAASDDSFVLIKTNGTGTTATISGLFFGDGDSTSVGQLRYNHSNNSMVFYTNSAIAFTISSTGGVSIARTDVSSPVAGDGNVFSGTYTPVQVSTNTNISSVAFSACQYMRVGDVVNVSGQITIDTNVASVDCVVNMSLPIASNIASSRQVAGSGSSVSSVYAANNLAIYGNLTSDCVEIRLNPSVTTSLIYAFSFTYQVL